MFNSLLSKEDEKTPLEIKLNDIAEDIGKFGLYSAILTFLALTLKLLYSKYVQYQYHSSLLHSNSTSLSNSSSFENSTYSNSTLINTTQDSSDEWFFLSDPIKVFAGIHKEILTILMLCVAIIVVAIPEGLPLAVTLALSFSVSKMMSDNNLVRHLSACETMGGANYILSDKTGTLTKNQMVVHSMYNNSNVVDLSKVRYRQNSSLKPNPLAYFSERYYQIVKEAIISNSDVQVNEYGNQIGGSKTDFALYNLISNFGEDYEKSKQDIEVKDRLPFDSDRKRMTTLLGTRKSNVTNITANVDVCIVHMKGGVEYILNSCDSYIDPVTGERKKLDDKTLSSIHNICDELSEKSLRCIGIAYKEIEKSKASTFRDNILIKSKNEYLVEQEKFSFIGVFAITDGLKENVPQAVNDCIKAGITVVMITGDNLKTARAIANECNILNSQSPEEACMLGSDFYSLIEGINCKNCNREVDYCQCKTQKEIEMESEGNQLNNENDAQIAVNCQKLVIGNIEAFKKVASNLKVLARARPLDKFAMVLGLKELDNVVAVTGDGTNDAMALKKADVGFSMGIEGTEIAKNASDIIILDDNFASIVSSIKWGRSIFDNIRKFIQFQLSVNLSAVLLVFVTSCIGSESPISAIQMLWLNLIMDSLGSLALATEAPSDDLLNRKPYSKREYLINVTMWKHIIVQSVFQFGIIFFLYIFAEKFIVEESEERINIISQLENCFGDFSAAVVKYQKHTMVHYILDGKKSSWNPIHMIKRDLTPEFCLFYDENRFKPGQINNLEHAYKWYVSEFGNTTHMTIVFNCFVLYSLFNQINSRILDQSFNIFKRLGSNILFVTVILIELAVQVLLVQTGGVVFKCALGGLTAFQWGVCLAFASITFWVSLFSKFISFEISSLSSKKESNSRDISMQMKENLIQAENRVDPIENI
jgi:Ca2+ transporting ATPase